MEFTDPPIRPAPKRGIWRSFGIITVALGIVLCVGFGLLRLGFLEDAELASVESKARVLGQLCLRYSNQHGGHYPRNLEELVETGLVSRLRFQWLTWIKPWSGPWATREWVYGPDTDGVLFCASEPNFKPVSSVSRIVVWIACKEGEAVTLGGGDDLPDGVHEDPYMAVYKKCSRLADLIMTCAEKHGGHYPPDLNMLANLGMTTPEHLRRILSIKDPDGPGKSRRWIYTPDNPEVLIYASLPVSYTHGNTGNYRTESGWVIYRRGLGVGTLTAEQLPNSIRESLTK